MRLIHVSCRLSFLLVFGLFAGGANCISNGECDGGPCTYQTEDAGQDDVITAADIGVECTYETGSDLNPTNTCEKTGLTCMITTSDGLYYPFRAGVSASNLAQPLWEDQTTVYFADGTESGQCTLVGTWAEPPTCPSGTVIKFFQGNVAACLRTCGVASDCPRSEIDVCDRRYLDLVEPTTGLISTAATCVRACYWDVPDCVRSGYLVTQADATQGAFYLFTDDWIGGSVCDRSSGICGISGDGASGPGQECENTSDCSGDLVCVQENLLNIPEEEGGGFCALSCQPNDQNPLDPCPTGYACQAGFELGHSPFLVKDAAGVDNQLGGFCFADCQSNPNACSTLSGTSCGSADTGVFGASSNQVSMCLPDVLRQ